MMCLPILGGCATGAKFDMAKVSKLRCAMSEIEVETLVGAPFEKDTRDDGTQIWSWRYGSPFWSQSASIKLKGGKVVNLPPTLPMGFDTQEWKEKVSDCLLKRIDLAARSIDNEYFTAAILPTSCDAWGCEAFRLTVKNKTNKNLELNWNKTLYVVQGQTAGGFMSEGVVFKDRNNPRSPDVIFPGSELSKTIWPNNLVSYKRGWENEDMPTEGNGVYLTVVVDGKEISEKLAIKQL